MFLKTTYKGMLHFVFGIWTGDSRAPSCLPVAWLDPQFFCDNCEMRQMSSAACATILAIKTE